MLLLVWSSKVTLCQASSGYDRWSHDRSCYVRVCLVNSGKVRFIQDRHVVSCKTYL